MTMTKFVLWVGLISCLFVGAAKAQVPAGTYDITVVDQQTGEDVTYRVTCVIDQGVRKVYINGFLAPGHTWEYDGNDVVIKDGGQGIAILQDAKDAAQGASGAVLDGNTGPPHQQAGTWERP